MAKSHLIDATSFFAAAGVCFALRVNNVIFIVSISATEVL
jgi:hypothetical protein